MRKIPCACTLVAMLLAAMLLNGTQLVGQSPAQEDNLPPPRRRPPEKRVQRGERLRKLTGQGGPLGSLLDSLTGNPAANSPPLDIPKLNEGIVALLQPLLDEEGGLEYLRVRLDPAETNLDRDTIHLVGAARLRRSAWSADPTQIDLDLRGKMRRRDDGRPQGVLDGGLRFQTDVVSLANRAMARFAARLERRAEQGSVRDGQMNAEETFRLRMREKLAATPPLQTMDDLIDLILSFSGLRLTAINDRIAELKSEVESTPEEKARLELVNQLAAARRQRDQMLDLRPRVERDEVGRAAVMRLEMDRSPWSETTQVERLKVEITGKRISLELVGSTSQGMELYSLFKPLLLNTLTRLQARDPDTVKLGRGMVRGYMGQLREALGGPEPDELPPPAEK